MFSRFTVRPHFHISRIMHGVFTLFHPMRLRHEGTSTERSGFEEHVDSITPQNGTSLKSAVIEQEELCSERYFIQELGTDDKRTAIEKLCKILKPHPGMIDPKKFCADVLKRENLKSTGIGYNVSIPHARSEYVDQILMAVGKSSEGIHFNSPDGSISHYIVLIGTPMEHVKGYLKLLAGIARMFKKDDVRKTLLSVNTREEMVSIFRANLEKWKI